MYEKAILIFGHGKWSQKVIGFLKKSKSFDSIYIKTSSKFFKIYPKKTEINLKEFKNHIENFKYLHICTPTKSHFGIIKFNNLNNKKIIIEKPLVKRKVDLDNIKHFFKLNKIIVNYIDLYNPLLLKVKKRINLIQNLNIDFGNNKLYLNKYDCLNEWLDHPLAIILYLFKKFTSYKIIYYENIKIKKKYFEKLHLNYCFKNISINIKINMKFPKSYRILSKEKKSITKKINLKQIPKMLNLNSINLLYGDLKSEKKNDFQKFNFHKKIFLEKQKIKKKILEKR